jgi:membrane-bound lytic murein transglycosylase B
MKHSSLLILLFLTLNAYATIKDQEAVTAFVNKMHDKHQFDKTELTHLFASVDTKNNILKTIAAPAEALAWHKYRKIFMSDSRIDGGVKFWQENEQALNAVTEQYGVPPEIIVAIIGVETRYGKNIGHHRVIDALSTLGFSYPKRSQFFLRELESFLLICRTEKLDPLQPTGSYAGAMGLPQFMPSSFLAYAVDFENNDHRDIWNNPNDAIASIANYFANHHWQTGQPIAFPVKAQGEKFKTALNSDLKPDTTIAKLQKLNVTMPKQLVGDTKVKLLSFKQLNTSDLWVGLDNFYVITRYNHSPLYAMAVYQLSQAILDKKK